MNETSSAERKMQMHLRMLYSQSYADSMVQRSERSSRTETCALSLMRTFDAERLAFERARRIESLAHHLRRQALALWEHGGERALLEHVAGFADSADFWRERGRSMLENFCLFAYGDLASIAGLSELARLLGVLSGVSARPGAASPWPDVCPLPAQLPLPGAIAAEAFVSRYDLVDDSGNIALGVELAEPRLVFVACFEDRSSVVGSIDRSAEWMGGSHEA